MSAQLKTITLNTVKMTEMINFYFALGINMEAAPVNKGSIAYKGKMGDLEISLLSILKKEKKLSPDISFRVQVSDIEDVMSQLLKIPGVEVLMDLQEMPEGKMAVVIDPDGHSVELSG